MYNFGTIGIIILFLTFLVCVTILFLLRKSIRKKAIEKKDIPFTKYGIIGIITGFLILSVSIVFHLMIRNNIINTWELIRPISEMTSGPALLLTIITCMFGLTIMLFGYSFLQFKVKATAKNSA